MNFIICYGRNSVDIFFYEKFKLGIFFYLFRILELCVFLKIVI